MMLIDHVFNVVIDAKLSNFNIVPSLTIQITENLKVILICGFK